MNMSQLKGSDLTSLLDLWNRSARFDPLSEPLLHEKIWGDPDFQDSLGVVLKHDGQLAALAFGVVRQGIETRTGFIKLLVVAPEYQGQGLGRRLVGELEQRLRGERVSSIRPAESAPNYLFPGIDVRYTQAMLLFESLDYQRIGETYNLEAELTGRCFSTQQEEEALVEHDIELRRATADDSSEIQRFLSVHWPDWQLEVQPAMENDPPTLHLAIKDEAVIGFSAHDCNNLGTAWFGPMGTCPTFRGKGIGGVLLKRCLADMQREGCPSSTIPWVGPLRFYARHVGAQIDRVFYRYEKII